MASLRQLSEILTKVFKDEDFAAEALDLADEVERAVYKHATREHPEFGQILAYEVDGYGNQLFMDDANVPSLLSLPYLSSIERDSDIYLNTRRFVLSDSNPYFYSGESCARNW